MNNNIVVVAAAVVALVLSMIAAIAIVIFRRKKIVPTTVTPVLPVTFAPPPQTPEPEPQPDEPEKTQPKTPKMTTKKVKKSKPPAGETNVGGGGESGQTNITFFGQSKSDDNGEGMAGIDLFGYINGGLTFQGRKVYPVAVHNKDFGKFMYKVIEINSPKFKSSVLGHVLDMCDEKDKVCNVNVKKNGLNFLVDIHATAFDVVGQSDGILTGTYKVVGAIPPRDIPKTAWIKQVQQGKGSFLCSCTTCTDNDKSMKWLELPDIGKC